MKIVITGASGFVGGHLARSLTKKHNIVALSRRPTPEADKYNWRQTDISQPLVIDDDSDVVIHAAAVADLQANHEISERVNLLGTEHVLRAAQRAGVEHFIFISTASVYDAAKNKYRVAEDFAKTSKKNNSYSVTKSAAEKLIEDSGLDATILRPHCIYGPCDTTILPGLFQNVKRGRLYLPIDKPKELSTTFIGNLCAVVHQITQRMPSGTNQYNVADEGYVISTDFIRDLLSLLEGCRVIRISPRLAKLILRLVPILNIDGATIDRLNEDSSLDIGKLKRDGYSLPYSRSEGLNHLSRWYASSGAYAAERAQVSDVWPSYENSPTY